MYSTRLQPWFFQAKYVVGRERNEERRVQHPGLAWSGPTKAGAAFEQLIWHFEGRWVRAIPFSWEKAKSSKGKEGCPTKGGKGITASSHLPPMSTFSHFCLFSQQINFPYFKCFSKLGICVQVILQEKMFSLLAVISN